MKTTSVRTEPDHQSRRREESGQWNIPHRRMSRLGRSRRFDDVRAAAALPPISDGRVGNRHYGFVPERDLGLRAARGS
jgi:hypothetical protein